MAQGMNGAWLALGVAGAVAAAGAVAGRSGSMDFEGKVEMRVHRGVVYEVNYDEYRSKWVAWGLGLGDLGSSLESKADAMKAAREKIDGMPGLKSKQVEYIESNRSFLENAPENYGRSALRRYDATARSGSRATKPWSQMKKAERERQERAFRRFKQQRQQVESRSRAKQEREPDWHRAWYDTSGELD